MQTLLTLALFAFLAYAKDIHLNVAPNSQPVIEPSSAMAEVDDVLIFHFPSSGTHSIVQGTFDSPCQPVDGGFYSGIIDGSRDPGTTFAVKVESLDTLWFFGGVGGMCGQGMLGMVNAPSEGGPTLDDWRGISRDTVTGPVNVPAGNGGVLGKADAPPFSPSASTTPPHPSDTPKDTKILTSTSTTSATIVTTTTDASGNQYLTSYGTAVGTGTSVVTTTIADGGNATVSRTGSGSARLVPSFDAGATGGKIVFGREGVVAVVLGVLMGLA